MPNKVWTSVALNFIVKLPKSKEPLTRVEYNSILVINNRLTKYTYLELYLKALTTEDLVYIFTKVVIARHRILEEIISNRDKLFTS
jgi:hypothetical protein